MKVKAFFLNGAKAGTWEYFEGMRSDALIPAESPYKMLWLVDDLAVLYDRNAVATVDQTAEAISWVADRYQRKVYALETDLALAKHFESKWAAEAKRLRAEVEIAGERPKSMGISQAQLAGVVVPVEPIYKP